MEVNKYVFEGLPIDYLRYERIKIYSLPDPYETNCKNYFTDDYNSKQSCISKCRLKYLSENNTGKWMAIYFTEMTESLANVTLHNSLVDLKTDYTLDADIGQKCKDFCGTNSECYSEYYKLGLVQPGHILEQPYITFLSPNRPDLVYRYLPKIYFVEFVLFVASSVSLWFGFSVLMLSDIIWKLCLIVKNKLIINNFVIFAKCNKLNLCHKVN